MDGHVRQGLEGFEIQALANLGGRIRYRSDSRGEVPDPHIGIGADGFRESAEIEPPDTGIGLEKPVVEVEPVDIYGDAASGGQATGLGARRNPTGGTAG